jgi:hypothetical protein
VIVRSRPGNHVSYVYCLANSWLPDAKSEGRIDSAQTMPVLLAAVIVALLALGAELIARRNANVASPEFAATGENQGSATAGWTPSRNTITQLPRLAVERLTWTIERGVIWILIPYSDDRPNGE